MVSDLVAFFGVLLEIDVANCDLTVFIFEVNEKGENLMLDCSRILKLHQKSIAAILRCVAGTETYEAWRLQIFQVLLGSHQKE